MNRLPPAAQLTSIGFYVAICIAGGAGGGHLLDQVAGTTPLMTMLGLFAGLVLAFYGGYRMLMDVVTPKRDRSNGKGA